MGSLNATSGPGKSGSSMSRNRRKQICDVLISVVVREDVWVVHGLVLLEALQGGCVGMIIIKQVQSFST